MNQSFNTWAAFLAECQRPPSEELQRDDIASTHDPFSAWSGGTDYRGALHLGSAGWAEGLKRVVDRSHEIEAQIGATDAITARFVEAGDEVDVGLHLEGDPESMVEYVYEPRATPVVRMLVSISASAGIHPDTIIARGAVIVAAIDATERSGVRVEVGVVFSNEGFIRKRGVTTAYPYSVTVRVKEAQDHLDRDRLAFALCHPAMLRRLMFRMNEIHGEKEWKDRGGISYGIPTNLTPADYGDAVYLPCMQYGDDTYANPENATRELIALLTSKPER